MIMNGFCILVRKFRLDEIFLEKFLLISSFFLISLVLFLDIAALGIVELTYLLVCQLLPC